MSFATLPVVALLQGGGTNWKPPRRMPPPHSKTNPNVQRRAAVFTNAKEAGPCSGMFFSRLKPNRSPNDLYLSNPNSATSGHQTNHQGNKHHDELGDKPSWWQTPCLACPGVPFIYSWQKRNMEPQVESANPFAKAKPQNTFDLTNPPTSRTSNSSL